MCELMPDVIDRVRAAPDTQVNSVILQSVLSSFTNKSCHFTVFFVLFYE